MTADAEVPAPFVQALRALRDRRLRGEVRLTEVPAPARIAPYSVALSAEVVAGAGDPDEDELASGRFVLLHDPAGQEAWDGTFRAVTLVRATLEPDMGADPLLCEAAWTWVTDALAELPVAHRALGGTVTRVVSQSFGTLADRPSQVEVEIRASWTAEGDLGEHLAAWATLLCTAAGLPPVPEGVTALGRRR
ncbi:DUF3000 domain-containing protein [Actinotalea sp.]|uniref:DUF3000 domain-containing protein n=1 Tax=Actinotalea sp. TaxID=1872145 RepID=UPI002B9C3AC7|nr:DUF3000 domain-containing protein [Actinotalea sp.]HQY33000.1 DUF3000 domain-containing protein [Actinotalea sp.]HRA51995.1 DUF3000 domain-containing protein [Actinotalea sp.]